MQENFVEPTLRGNRQMWHREVFCDIIARALNISVQYRASAEELLDVVRELEGF